MADAVEMARAVRAGEVSAAELVDAALARIDAMNPRLNAVIHRFDDTARADVAAAADGPFRGVPLVLKDLGIQRAGDPFHCGSRFLADLDWRSDHDSELTRRFRAAGFVVVGRTATPEFGSVPTTESLAYGATHNPWKLGYSPGGSSGGSAAIVAAGALAVGHGGDGGGSIRIPASACGLVGLKPSRGRISAAPDAGEGWGGFATDGVITTTVRDSAALLDVMAGPAPGDPYTAPPPDRPFAAEVAAPPGALRIGLLTAQEGVAVDPDCAAAVEAAGILLEGLGHRVEPAPANVLGDLRGFFYRFGRVVSAAVAADAASWEAAIGRDLTEFDLEPGNWYLLGRGRQVSAEQYLTALGWLHAYTRRVATFWSAGFDVLVTPTLPIAPPPHGWFYDPAEGNRRVRQYVSFTAPFNATGQPAVSLPLGESAEGLPIGVQFVGPAGGEALLLRLAAQLEAAAPWAAKRPPVWAG